MSIIDELIFDRTEEDLDVAKNKIRNNEPLPNDNLRYSWDYRALNRTEEAMQYINEIFKELGYFRNMGFKTDWFADEITPEQSKRYIENLKTLRSFILLPSTTPIAPNTINGMSLERANEIEKIIYDIDIVLKALQNNYVYSGVCGSGQDRVWQQRFRRKPYKEVKYLESTGTQYIDTGFIPNLKTKVQMSFEFNEIKSQDGLFGAQKNGELEIAAFVTSLIEIGCRYSDSQNQLRFGDEALETDVKYNLIIDGKNKSATFNSTTKTYRVSPTLASTQNIILFGYHTRSTGNVSTGTLSKIKLYSCEIYDDDVLVRDFVPCINNNGTACLIDKVENKFYYNQGTGNFVAGD